MTANSKELRPQAFTIGGQPAWTFDALPEVGAPAPDFHLADAQFKDWTLADFAGTRLLLNIVPSLDTPVCALSARKFNADAAARPGVKVLTVSADLPFAQARFCENLKTPGGLFLSTFRAPEFGMDYGTLIVDHPMMGLQARAVVAIGADGRVLHAQLVPELSHEPDYAAAWAALDAAAAPDR